MNYCYNSCRGGQPYESPTVETFEIDVEGPMCNDSPNNGYGLNDLGEI